MARARLGLAPLVQAMRPRFVEALLFDVVYKNPVSSYLTTQPFIICYLHPQSTNTVLCAALSLPSPRSLSRPYLPCIALPITPQKPTSSTRTDSFEHNSARSRLRQPEFEDCPKAGQQYCVARESRPFKPSQSVNLQFPRNPNSPLLRLALFDLQLAFLSRLLDSSPSHPLQRAPSKRPAARGVRAAAQPVPLKSHLPSPLPASAGLIQFAMTGTYPMAKRPRGLDRLDSKEIRMAVPIAIMRIKSSLGLAWDGQRN